MRFHGSIALGVAGLAVAAAFTGCHRGPGPVYVASVRVALGSLAAPLREAGLERAALEEATREALAASGFRAGEGRRTYRARLEVLSLRLGRGGDDGVPRAEIAVRLALEPAEGEGAPGAAVVETGLGRSPLAAGRSASAWRSALESAVGEAAAGLAVALGEEGRPEARLIADLEARDPRVREHAIRVLAQRRSTAAVPALIAKLGDPEPDLAERAVGALAQIRDPRAVDALIERAQRGDPVYTMRLLRIIGDIGGSEARGYLQTLEAGHPDARVRAVAREALEELEAQAREGERVAHGE